MKEPRIISVEIVQDDIEHRMSLGEFKELLKYELGSITFMTTAGYHRRIDAAIDRIVQRVRDAKA